MDIVIYAYEQDACEQPAEAPAAPSNDELPAAA